MSIFHGRQYISFAVFLFGIAAVGVFFLMPVRSLAENPTPASSSDATGLRRQRIETLQLASNNAHQMYANGVISVGEVFRVDRLLLDAQLESSVAREDRIKLLQAALDLARRQEDLASRQLNSGFGTAVTALEAKADRLRIEIQLAETAAK